MALEFDTTQWTMIVQAAESQSDHSHRALESLCRAYWKPLYAYVRSFGHSHEDAEDTTQAFFTHLVETNLHGRADRDRGRFRTFLLMSLKNYMRKVRRDAMAQKRGGGEAVHVSFDNADESLLDAFADDQSPAAIFEKKWALTVLEQAMKALENEQVSEGQKQRFTVLKPRVLDPDRPESGDQGIAEQLGLSEGAARTVLSRLRTRYRELVRVEVARLVADPADVDDEIAHLAQVLTKAN